MTSKETTRARRTARSLLVLVLVVAAVAGACFVAVPVFLKTWPLTLAAAAVGFAFAAGILVRSVKRDLPAARRKHGLCAYCGYDLTGNVSGVCPECGSSTN